MDTILYNTYIYKGQTSVTTDRQRLENRELESSSEARNEKTSLYDLTYFDPQTFNIVKSIEMQILAIRLRLDVMLASKTLQCDIHRYLAYNTS